MPTLSAETGATAPAESSAPVDLTAQPAPAEALVPPSPEGEIPEPTTPPDESTPPEVSLETTTEEAQPSGPTEALPVVPAEEELAPSPEVAPPAVETIPAAEAGPVPETSPPEAPPPEERTPEAPETVSETPLVEGEPPVPSPAPPPLEPTLEVPPPPAPTPPGAEPAVPTTPVAPAAPAAEAPAPAVVPPPVEPEPPAPPSGVELTVGGSLVASLGGFLDSTSAGHHGVCVVRESPERIRARVGSRPIEVYWLSNIGRGPSLRPADLEGIWTMLSRKLLEEHSTAFFLEGIEYLVRIHGADAVLTGLVQFDRLARENDARVWVYLTPALMKPADIERFQATFGGNPPS